MKNLSSCVSPVILFFKQILYMNFQVALREECPFCGVLNLHGGTAGFRFHLLTHSGHWWSLSGRTRSRLQLNLEAGWAYRSLLEAHNKARRKCWARDLGMKDSHVTPAMWVETKNGTEIQGPIQYPGLLQPCFTTCTPFHFPSSLDPVALSSIQTELHVLYSKNGEERSVENLRKENPEPAPWLAELSFSLTKKRIGNKKVVLRSLGGIRWRNDKVEYVSWFKSPCQFDF